MDVLGNGVTLEQMQVVLDLNDLLWEVTEDRLIIKGKDICHPLDGEGDTLSNPVLQAYDSNQVSTTSTSTVISLVTNNKSIYIQIDGTTTVYKYAHLYMSSGI